MKKVIVTVKYTKIINRITGERIFSHQYVNEWIKTDLFCLMCGKQGVYHEQGSTDMDQGEDYICTHCSSIWTMWPAEKIDKCPNDNQKLEQLIAARIEDERAG